MAIVTNAIAVTIAMRNFLAGDRRNAWSDFKRFPNLSFNVPFSNLVSLSL
ncbi:hypothetical protein SuNHUV7_27090 (plasmid) [Pseudoseohaeicola sp. NH-UV-7]|jgi:hypothetical protein|nr:hypothetical protein [Sulfitobacter sp. JL08]